MRLIFRCLCLGLLAAAVPALAQDARYASGPAQTVLIELYTSQGCNSCPPAEAYLNSYTTNPSLWSRYIPLAFHVDYWDYIGWKDRYAHPRHAQRQRRYAQRRRVSTVYTPAFVVNGESWRPLWPVSTPSGGGAAIGTLEIRLRGREFEASFKPATAAPAELRLDVAILGMGLQTDIRAGENAGRHSRHEFVVLAHEQYAAPELRARGALPTPPKDIDAPRYALVAWLSRPGDPSPVQAVGGFLPADVVRALK